MGVFILLGAGLGQVADDGGVGVEEIVTGHAGLAGDTSGDDNDVAAGKSILEAVVLGNVASNLYHNACRYRLMNGMYSEYASN